MDIDELCKELLKKETLTTGRVAAATGVSIPTVHRWLAQGLIRGWRLPPTIDGRRGARRVLASSVVALLKAGEIKPKEAVELTV